MSDTVRLLSTLPPSRADRRLAGVVICVSLSLFVAIVPFAKMPLTPVAAFIPIYESALVITDTVTAVLLFAQFGVRRSLALLVLASAYLYTALLTAAHALTFPGLFAPGGLLGAGTQTTAWLYMFWHGGFPAFVVAYAVLEPPPPARASLASTAAVTCAVAAVAAAALACVVTATAGHDALPQILRDGQYSTAYKVTVSLVWLACVAALVTLWRKPARTVLDLWLIVVLVAWTLDIALAAVLNAKRFDVGFYAGRIYGLLAASFVLMVLLVETTVLYARVANAHRRERAERRRLAEQGRELAAAYRELDAFSYSVSHDLRAPLRAIDGYARMLEEDYGDRLDAEARRLIAVVRASSANMAQLIDDLLALSRVSRERMRLREVAVEPIVRAAISEAMTANGDRTVEFEVGDLGEARADPSLLRHLYANLIGNAVKFTAHARPARVTIGREMGMPAVYFVKDNGAGFDMRHAGQLFSAFTRLHSSDEFPGTGIGLAIVARVVARHDGRVWAEAEPGRGAVFRFTLGASA